MGLLKYGALFVLVIQNSTLVLTMRHSRSQVGHLYIASTAVVMSELTKLMMVLVLIGVEEKSVQGLWKKLYLDMVCKPMEFAKLVVPACLYTLQSNLLYVAVSNLDAVTYQVLYQLKILTTAIFSVVLLRRHLHLVQWLSLLLLLGGVTLVQVSNLEATGSGDNAMMAVVETRTAGTTKGLAAVISACCSSGFAGVYFEQVLKSSKISLWVRNIELALIGIVAGLGGLWYSDAQAILAQGFFYGYTSTVWCVIGLQALGGIVVALVVKYTDSVLKGFSTAISIVASCLVSHLFLEEDVQISPRFILGIVLVMFATIMYSLNYPMDIWAASAFRSDHWPCHSHRVVAKRNGDAYLHIPLTDAVRGEALCDEEEAGKRDRENMEHLYDPVRLE